jgi:hypothetical protein
VTLDQVQHDRTALGLGRLAPAQVVAQVAPEGNQLGDLPVEDLDAAAQAVRDRAALGRAVLVVQPDQFRDVSRS